MICALFNRSDFKPALAAMLMLGASPVLAQTPEEPSTRAGLMQTGSRNVGPRVRDATAVGHRTGSVLVRQPVRVGEAVWRMEGHPSRRRRLPRRRRHQVRHRLRQGADVGRSRSDSSPTASISRHAAAYSTTGLRACERRRERTQPRRLARSTLACPASTTSSRRKTFSASGMDSLESNRTNYLLDAIETGGAVRWKPSRLDFGGGVAYFSPRVGQRNRQSISVD